jgi:hypothetical protein
MAKVARRYLPVVATLAALVLIIALVPSVSDSRPPVRPLASGAGAGLGAGSEASPSNTTGASSALGAGPAVPASSSPSVAGGPGAQLDAGSPARGSQSPSQSPSGVARSGVACGTGVRQVTWSHYAPLCVPAFTATNGGATWRGVTGSTITVTYRLSQSGEAAAVNAAAQGAFPSQQQVLSDLQTYVNFFNTKFELYGRHVDIKTFAGQGDWVAELQNQNLGAAQADAVTAHDKGAFADISQAIDVSTEPYVQDLAAEGVISVGGVVASQPFLERNAPYVYTVIPTITDLGNFEGSLLCQRMAGLPAVFAGDPLLKSTTRVFGIINPENPDYAVSGATVEKDLRGCGSRVAKHITYALDIPTLSTQDTSIIAQMKAAGVTTVVCGICDDVSPLFLTRAADAQGFHPEWVTIDDGDQYGQLYSQSQYRHAVGPGEATPVPSTTEAYKVFRLANPNGQPAELSRLGVAYAVALQLFDGLQAAGPELTPTTFERGEFSLPPSLTGGDLGPWQFGAGVFSPQAGLPVGWYDPNAVSPINGQRGSWRSCAGDDGAFHSWVPPSAFGPVHTQLRCFG